jgi:hypothetical protein
MNRKDIVNSVGVFNDIVAMTNILSEYYWDEQWFMWVMLGV